MTNDLFGTFTITEQMRERAEENKEDIESEYLDTMRDIGIAFCEEFNTNGNFDMRGNPNGDMCLMYVSSIGIGPSVIIDGNIWRNSVDEFLSFIEDSENYIEELTKKFSTK